MSDYENHVGWCKRALLSKQYDEAMVFATLSVADKLDELIKAIKEVKE